MPRSRTNRALLDDPI